MRNGKTSTKLVLIVIVLVALGIAAGIGVGYWKNLGKDFGVLTGVTQTQAPSGFGAGYARSGGGRPSGFEAHGPAGGAPWGKGGGGGHGRPTFQASLLLDVAGYAVLLAAFAALTYGIDRKLRNRRTVKAIA